MQEYFIIANSFAAPFCSDESRTYVTGQTPLIALQEFATRYSHPYGLYAAAAYKSADAYHKGEKPLAKWLSNKSRQDTTVGKNPKDGYAEYVVS